MKKESKQSSLIVQLRSETLETHVLYLGLTSNYIQSLGRMGFQVLRSSFGLEEARKIFYSCCLLAQKFSIAPHCLQGSSSSRRHLYLSKLSPAKLVYPLFPPIALNLYSFSLPSVICNTFLHLLYPSTHTYPIVHDLFPSPPAEIQLVLQLTSCLL